MMANPDVALLRLSMTKTNRELSDKIKPTIAQINSTKHYSI